MVGLYNLILYDNSFTGEIPSSIANLPLLRVLYLSDNQFTGTIPEGIWQMLNLRSIRLSNNNLSGQLPSDIGGLDKLYDLHLSDNQFTGTLPTEFGENTQLEGFVVRNNQFTGTIPEDLLKMKRLRELDLHGNSLTGDFPTELDSLVKLETLDISNNQFTGELPSTIGKVVELMDFYIQNNQLTGDIPAEIANLAELRQADFSNNQFTSLPEEINALTDLWRFYIDSNLLTTLPDMSDLDMYRFHLRGNNLTFGDLESSGYDFSDYNQRYSPQESLPVETELLYVNEGDDASLNFHTLVTDLLFGTNNEYALFKSEDQVYGWDSNPGFIISSFSDADEGEYIIKVKNDDYDKLTLTSDTIIIKIKKAPTDISLSNNLLEENVLLGTYIGKFSTSDENEDDEHSYTVVSGNGTNDADNSSITISEDSVFISVSTNYEIQKEYYINVQTQDFSGLTFTKSFIINILNKNEAPFDISLSNSSVDENKPKGTIVGSFDVSDEDANDTHTYIFVEGDGTNDAGNSSFEIDGTNLKTTIDLDYETQSEYYIYIQVEDAKKLSYKKAFVISITDVTETGLSDIYKKGIKVYPNPSSGVFTLEFNSDSYLVSIYSVIGNKVYENISNTSKHKIDLSNYPKGIYFVKIKKDNKVYNNRIILE
jgi:Leucine-rich repeat (LRR) protein